MTVQPTNTKMELANLLVGMHDNRVQTLGQKRALEQDPCHGYSKGVRYPFPVNNEMFTANETCEILSLINAKVIIIRLNVADHSLPNIQKHAFLIPTMCFL